MNVLNLGKIELTKFPNAYEISYKKSIFPHGEIFFRLTGEVPYDVDIIARLNSSEDVMELVMATDALRRAGAVSVRCHIPFLPYSQQDRVCSPGESLSLKVFGDLLNSLNFDSVTVLDPHSSVCESVIDRLVVIDNSSFIKAVLCSLKKDKLNIIVPDEGASKKIYGLTPIFEKVGVEINLVICSKLRDLKTSKIIRTVVPKIENDWDNLIIDDISLLGNTFINIAKELNQNVKTYLAVTHGVFNGGFETLKEHFIKVFCTNSVRDISPNGFVEQIKIL
jgi:ribose-phosphate pyrophosphokinase